MLGIAYNAFDGLELLIPSIKTVRNVADHICIVYQEKSNFGNPISEYDLNIIDQLKNMSLMGFVDEIVKYVPTVNNGHINELAKRNLGLDRCTAAGCDYHMTMDVDEFYVEEQLNNALNIVIETDVVTSLCKMQTYWKSSKHVLDPPEEYFVPLIYKIDGRRFDMRTRWHFSADPTRRMEMHMARIFNREEIEMHHMSYVRRDISSKLNNSSASGNFKHRIADLTEYYQNWLPGMKASLGGREERLYDLREVTPLFDI